MKVRVLGSGTLRPDPDRGSPAYWVEVGEHRILLDCGSGALKALAQGGVDWQEISCILLSHFHTDHVGDLPPLLFAFRHALETVRDAPLTIAGPTGIADHLEALARAYGDFIRDPGFPIDVVELNAGTSWRPSGAAYQVHTHPTIHSDASIAFRLESDDGAIGYTGDTGPDPSLGDFFGECHLLLAECSNPDQEATWNHLTPRSLADLAKSARPGLLVTVHVYPPLRPEEVPDLLRRSVYMGDVVAGSDGLVLAVRSGRVLRLNR
jgi:ribonuclease BN (tRNA processing enzyme)